MRSWRCQRSPDLPFLAFLEFLAFFSYKEFLAFLSVFPFFPKDFTGSLGKKNPCFFGGFPCLLPKKQGKEDQGRPQRGSRGDPQTHETPPRRPQGREASETFGRPQSRPKEGGPRTSCGRHPDSQDYGWAASIRHLM